MTCDTCIHYDLCQAMEAGHGLEKVPPAYCGYYKDNSKYIEIPCKVGDKLFFVGDIPNAVNKFVYHDTVTKIGVAVRGGIYEKCIDISDFGKAAFLTENGAEQALNDDPKMKGEK